MENSEQLRDDEILAIESIYGEDLYLTKFSSKERENSASKAVNSSLGGIIKIVPVPTSTSYTVIFGTSSQSMIETSFLPPIFLKFELPEDYPNKPPLISIECLWINDCDLKKIQNKLQEIWEVERSEVLYLFADYLQNVALDELGMGKEIIVREDNVPFKMELPLEFAKVSYPENLLAASTSADGSTINLHKLILNWKKYKLQSEFKSQIYSCGICFDEKKGRRSIALKKCGHVYCRDCLSGFFQMLIREGMMLAVLCPHESCRADRKDKETGCKTILPDPNDVKDLVSYETFSRYQRLLRKQTMELDPLITWCPHCEDAVLRKTIEEKLCQCPTCSFAFCRLCLRTWHGNQTYCLIHNTNKLTEKYFKAREAGNVNEMNRLEFQYGKKHIAKLMAEFDSQRQFEEWQSQNAQPCPNCSAVIEKAYGCNHMTCPVCDQHFCYICGESINKFNPYLHFNDLGSRCHMMLFEGVANDADDDFFIDPFEIADF